MLHVKVDATNSTNQLAKGINYDKKYDMFCVSTDYQSNGRGQKESKWVSEKSKNLMLTIVFNNLGLEIENKFILNILVCLKIHEVLETFKLDNLVLKWPNDILAENKKIGGVLIENTISNNLIQSTYIGIGLNVNQEKFPGLPQAGSLKNLLRRNINRDGLLKSLINNFKDFTGILNHINHSVLFEKYKYILLGYNKKNLFVYEDKEIYGTITDVRTDGSLVISFTDATQEVFQFKEISQVF